MELLRRISSVDGVTPLEATDDRPLFTPAALNSVPVPSFCNVQLLGKQQNPSMPF